MGRPSDFDPAVIDEILERIVSGDSVMEILDASRPEHFPSEKTFFSWLAKGARSDAEPALAGFLQNYTRACEARTTAQAERILYVSRRPNLAEIMVEREVTGENGSSTLEIRTIDNTERTKIEIDAMKWTMAKMLPKKYGRQTETDSGEENGAVIIRGGLPDNE